MTSELRRVCVFCASSPGTDPAITEATVVLGRILAEREIELVYGGGAVGLMGLVADTVLEAGGTVTGVIPTGLYDHADAFIALPGGFGTLEELAEVLTWNQIGLLAKPVGVLDVGGFWQPLLHLLDTMVDKTILKAQNRGLLLDDPDPGSLLDRLEATTIVHEPKWIGEERT
ncbi:MAG: TIGR00730 family Rossman fold protein [Actinobacteria bacterium]|nr:TIGR00730 family Rossman fold protein [Actinomycetota bacterium]